MATTRPLTVMRKPMRQTRSPVRAATGFSSGTPSGRKPRSANHAACAAGQVDAVNLKKLLESCKIAISVSPRGDTGPRETNAVGTLLKMVTQYNEKHIKFAVTIIPDAYGEARGMMRAMLLKALAEFSNRQPAADRQALCKALQGMDPRKMEADVRASQKIQGGGNVMIMCDILEKAYKKMAKGKV